MKKSELKKIIKEEVTKVFSEIKVNKPNQFKDIKIIRDKDRIDVKADSGEYTGYVEEDGKVSFSVIRDEEFTEDDWKDILGEDHAFVKIINKIGGEVEAIDDYVTITVDSSKLF
jgi:hypothetical protein